MRAVETSRQPLRVVIDRHAETPAAARVLAQAPRARRHGRGAQRWLVDGCRDHSRCRTPQGASTCRRSCASSRVAASTSFTSKPARGSTARCIAAGLIDEVLHYVAPSVLGDPARGMFELAAPLSSLDDRVALDWHSVDRVGTDLRLIARIRALVARSCVHGNRASRRSRVLQHACKATASASAWPCRRPRPLVPPASATALP